MRPIQAAHGGRPVGGSFHPAAGHGDALATFLEVLEQEAEDRRHRRINPLRRESRLPSGKTWETPVFTGAGSSSTIGCPWRCGSNWIIWPRAASSSATSTCWPSDCLAPARPMPGAPWATAWWKPATPSSSLRPTVWCRNSSPPSATWTCPASCASWTTSTSCSWDDLGYLPQGAEESEVLFTLITEHYERRSLGIASNLVFSEWERIFANPMATAAVIDRVVHHSVILEFDVPSYRTNAAQQRVQAEEVNRQN